jgi:hypothetical protein
METFWQTVAANPLLQALAIAGSIAGLLIATYQLIKQCLRWFRSWQARSSERSVREAERAFANTSYALAVFARHFVVLIGLLLAHSWLSLTQASLRAERESFAAADTLILVLALLLFVLSGLIGSRGASIYIVARRIMDRGDRDD